MTLNLKNDVETEPESLVLNARNISGKGFAIQGIKPANSDLSTRYYGAANAIVCLRGIWDDQLGAKMIKSDKITWALVRGVYVEHVVKCGRASY